MTEKLKLKNCPFCGEAVEIHSFANPKYYFTVKCKGCGVSADYFKGTTSFNKGKTESENAKLNKLATIKAWNNRVTDTDRLLYELGVRR